MNAYIDKIIYDMQTTDRHYGRTLATVLLSASLCLALIFSLDFIYALLRQPLLALVEAIDPSPQNDIAVRETVSMLASLILSALATLLPALLPCIFCGRTRKKVCASPAKRPGVNVFAYIPFAIGAGYIASLASNVLFGFTDRFTETAVETLPSSVPGIILYFVYVAVLPAITEEILFRGAIMGALMPYGKTQALIISSVLFGLAHVNPMQAIFAAVLGIIIGELYAQTGSIWWGSLIHFLNNAISVALSYLLQIYGEDDIIVLGISGIIIYALIIFATIYGIASFARYKKSKRLVDLAPPHDSRYRDLSDAARQLYGKSAYATAIFCIAYVVSLIYRYFI